MKISTVAQISPELYEEHPEVLKTQLRTSICAELLKHEVFIGPPMVWDKPFIRMEMHLFALSSNDLSKLEALSDKYPFLRKELHDIIVNVTH